MIHHTQAKSIAEALLRKVLKQAMHSGDMRLPTCDQLANLASVSKPTMLKVVKEFSCLGVLSAKQGAGIRLVNPENITPEKIETAASEKPHGRKWEKLYARIESDLIHGEYPASSVLPSSKDLCIRYGVAYKTLRKALDKLVNEQVIVPSGRSYRLTRLSMHSRVDSILLIAFGDTEKDIALTWEADAERFRLLEDACDRAGIRLLTRPGYWTNNRMAGCKEIAAMIHDPGKAASILGCIVWCSGLQPDFLEDLVPLLAGTRKPIAILEDESGKLEIGALAGKNPLVILFEPFANEAGLKMARHLVSLGHRNLAYIYREPRQVWTRKRLAGMQQEISLHNGTITSFGYEAPPLSISPSTVKNAMKKAMPHRIAKGVFLYDTNRIEWDFAFKMSLLAQRKYSWVSLYPTLEKLLSRTDITAWVCAQDQIAADCYDFLTARKIAVPAQISLAGFDDANEASVLKLTSYNFNNAACTEAMLWHVLHPSLRRSKRPSSNIVGIRGFITMRRSTGKARPV